MEENGCHWRLVRQCGSGRHWQSRRAGTSGTHDNTVDTALGQKSPESKFTQPTREKRPIHPLRGPVAFVVFSHKELGY